MEVVGLVQSCLKNSKNCLDLIKRTMKKKSHTYPVCHVDLVRPEGENYSFFKALFFFLLQRYDHVWKKETEQRPAF